MLSGGKELYNHELFDEHKGGLFSCEKNLIRHISLMDHLDFINLRDMGLDRGENGNYLDIGLKSWSVFK